MPSARQIGVEPLRDLGADLVAARPDRRPDDAAVSRAAERGDAASTTPAGEAAPAGVDDGERRRGPSVATIAIGTQSAASASSGTPGSSRPEPVARPRRAPPARARCTIAVCRCRFTASRAGIEPELGAGEPAVLGDPRRVVAAAAEVERGVRAGADAALARRERDDVRPGRLPADHRVAAAPRRARAASRAGCRLGLVDDLVEQLAAARGRAPGPGS